MSARIRMRIAKLLRLVRLTNNRKVERLDVKDTVNEYTSEGGYRGLIKVAGYDKKGI